MRKDMKKVNDVNSHQCKKILDRRVIKLVGEQGELYVLCVSFGYEGNWNRWCCLLIYYSLCSYVLRFFCTGR